MNTFNSQTLKLRIPESQFSLETSNDGVVVSIALDWKPLALEDSLLCLQKELSRSFCIADSELIISSMLDGAESACKLIALKKMIF